MTDRTRRPRPRINWFSPLPPATTAIAHYALRTVLAVTRHADVTVWTTRAYWPREIEACATVRIWDGDAWPALNAADATLYHIGNNELFHAWIWDVARLHPGIVVLHDSRLHEFFASQLLDDGEDPTAYLDAVRRCHGDGAAAEAGRMLRGEMTADALAEALPLTELAVERARGAVVHATAAFEHVAALGRCPVMQLDLPYGAGAPLAARQWDGVLRLVVFGYLAANRRLDALLQAIASFPGRARLRLEILGQHRDAAGLRERITELGLDDIVQVRGFVPEPQLDEALDRSSLAVNLRYPTMGEASDSQLRIWSRGLASLVTRTGWYAELPPETVWFVDPANEQADLHTHFAAALANPESLRTMGNAGRRALESRHDPDRYAAELVEGVTRMMETPASIAADAVETVSRIAAEGRIGGAARAGVARRTAEAIARWIAPPQT